MTAHVIGVSYKIKMSLENLHAHLKSNRAGHIARLGHGAAAESAHLREMLQTVELPPRIRGNMQNFLKRFNMNEKRKKHEIARREALGE